MEENCVNMMKNDVKEDLKEKQIIISSENEKMLINSAEKRKEKELNDYEFPLHDDTTCGIWCIKGPFLQRFANKKAYVVLYGVIGCIFSAAYAYSTGTITTLEKRFKIPSRNTGKSFALRRRENDEILVVN